MPQTFLRYEEQRPDELAAYVPAHPIAFWPLGLLEHHSFHLPIGFDGLKAQRLCERIAGQTGGVLLPTLWWGGIGGHGDFLWTHYQEPDAARSILATTARQLLEYGFRVLVFMAGHYPWQQLLDEALPPLQSAYPQALLIWGTEVTIAGSEAQVQGDHAAREETSFGLALLPELVDLQALRPGHDNSVWPHGTPPAGTDEYPGLVVDPASPLFAQYGVDARLASAERGEQGLRRVAGILADRIKGFLP